MWIIAAFQCFLSVLFTGKLPASAAKRLPEGALPALPAAEPKAEGHVTTPTTQALPEPSPAPAPEPAVPKPVAGGSKAQREGALALLGLLQREGRLVDFLQESIDDYGDDDVGAAVRDIHRGCKKVLEDHVTLEPVMPGDEDDDVKVPDGFDPGEVRLIGEVKGDPPFRGVLRHHGWRATKAELPTLAEGVDRRILAPAEVEIS